MQVPERLTLIGGGILLSSLLIFSLKSQASDILPKIAHPLSSISDHTSDAQNGNNFSDDFQNAQRKGWQTGQWGTAKFYVSDHHDMYIGSGSLQGSLKDLGNVDKSSLHSLNFEGPVVAPQDSSYLLTPTQWNDNPNLTNINGAEKIDTSHVTNMYRIFGADNALKSVDVSTWDVSHVNDLSGAFVSNVSLQNINGLNNWDLKNTTTTAWTFYNMPSMRDIDLSHWNTPNLVDADHMFANNLSLNSIDISSLNTDSANTGNIFGFNNGWNHTDNSLSKITLSDKAKLTTQQKPAGNWKNEESGQILNSDQLMGNDSDHPGTWLRQ